MCENYYCSPVLYICQCCSSMHYELVISKLHIILISACSVLDLLMFTLKYSNLIRALHRAQTKLEYFEVIMHTNDKYLS